MDPNPRSVGFVNPTERSADVDPCRGRRPRLHRRVAGHEVQEPEGH